MVIVILATFDCEPAPNFGQFVSAAITHRRVSAPKVEKRTKENQTSCLLLCCNLVISSPSSSTALGSSPQFPSSFVQHHQNPCHVLHCNAQDKGRSGWCHWSSSSSWSFKLSQWLKNLRQKLFNPINALQISQISWFMRFFALPYWFSSSPRPAGKCSAPNIPDAMLIAQEYHALQMFFIAPAGALCVTMHWTRYWPEPNFSDFEYLFSFWMTMTSAHFHWLMLMLMWPQSQWHQRTNVPWTSILIITMIIPWY